MKTPHGVEEMLRLKACYWGVKRIACELGCSHHTVKHDVATGGATPFRAPPLRLRILQRVRRSPFPKASKPPPVHLEAQPGPARPDR
jgi:hypothetical protein